MKDIIVALDRSDWKENLKLVEDLGDNQEWYKVGPILFLQCPEIIKTLKNLGKKVMLDLKFHDIPNTVKKACATARSVGVDMLTIHLMGGSDMVKAAMEGVGVTHVVDGDCPSLPPVPIVLGVSVLTSHDEASLQRIGFTDNVVSEHVSNLVSMGLCAGVEGIVCSPLETKLLRSLGALNDFIIVNPGVRLPTDDKGDQARVTTPKQAFENGASHVVIGRPIYQADDPVAALQRVKDSLQ